jgi:DNA-binding response OmpR family regulator
MSSQNPIILLLEDCPVTAMLVERVILQGLPACRLMWARTVAEARERSSSIQIDLFIIDIVLPDGSGLDFLGHAAVTHPSACAIVVTATALPEYQVMSAALGALHFIEKPVKPSVLLEHFRATLDNVTPMDILQLKCLSVASSIVEFRSDHREGRVRFQKGEVVDARTGSLRGIDAVREIIGWPHGHVFEHPESGEFERTIHCSWQALLMHAAHEIDEQQARTATG